jgi:hypothetical protein
MPSDDNAAEPKVGVDFVVVDSRRHGPRTFRRVGSYPYVRRDGSHSCIETWQASCVVCGAPYEVTTPAHLSSPPSSGAFQVVTCPLHRATVVPVPDREMASAWGKLGGRPPGPRLWMQQGISRSAWYRRRAKARRDKSAGQKRDKRDKTPTGRTGTKVRDKMGI